MFYLAVSCIALGLLCLLYLGFTLSGRRDAEGDSMPASPAPGAHPRPPQEPFRPLADRPAPQPAPSAAPSPIAPSTVAPSPVAPSTVAPSPVAPSSAGPANRPGDIPAPPTTRERAMERAPERARDGVRERTTEFRRIDTDALADTLRVYARREAPPRESVQPLIVSGILYMNNSRYLPAAAGQSPGGESDFAPRAFANLRRVGQGTLVMEGGGFHIHCGNANYSYSVSDLEQIVFQDRGVALIPSRHDHAVPVFITAEPERIKNYIKKHAHIIHGRP